MSVYMGDVYQGDGGLLRSLGGLVKRGAGALLKRSPIGMVAGTAIQMFRGPGLPAPTRPGQGIGLPGPFRISPTRFLPGGQPFITREGGQVPPGYHLNKSRVYARAAAEPGSYAVRNRQLNPANPRALRRAVRRERGFVVLARRVLKGTGLTISRKGMGRGKKRKRR